MSKLSERQRLILTIAVSVLLAGGLLALILKDRAEIESVRDEISGLDQRIRLADVEIRRTRDREDQVLVFRAVESRELAVLPTRQKIASFHRNLSTFLASAGLGFQELPESTPVESGLAKGIFVTRSPIAFTGDAASTLKFVNMMENDPRLIAVKGLTVKAGAKDRDNPAAPVLHDIELTLETYFYNPATGAMDRVHIPSAEARLQDPKIRQAIASFQPERPDTYVLRPSASRRDPLVDPRVARVTLSEEELQEAWREQEAVVLELESWMNDVNEKVETELALGQAGDLFRRDRLSREVDERLNEVLARMAQLDQVKTVTIPELVTRVEAIRGRVDELRGRRPPREMKVPRSVAVRTLEEVTAAFQKGDYTEVSNLTSQWAQYVDGKEIDPAAVEIVNQIYALRPKAKTFSDFQSIPIRVTGTIVHPVDPGRSVALINGRPLHIGERLNDQRDVVIAEITKESVIFHFRGEAIRVPRRQGGKGSDDKPQAKTYIEPVNSKVEPAVGPR